MAINYAYMYAVIEDETTGECIEVQDTTNFILARTHVPITEFNEDYILKYYWPLPNDPVTSFDDFQGLWYEDAEHTILAEGLN